MEFLQLAASFLAVFLLSIAVSYLLGKIIALRQSPMVPPENALLRVMTPNGVHRARFIGIVNGGWAFTAPLQRDAYVPISPGALLVIEASSPGGALLLRTKLATRTPERILVTERAQRVFRRERRLSPRLLRADLVEIQGERGQLLDVSEGGSRLITAFRAKRGDHVQVKIPWVDKPICGFVMEIESERSQSVVRLRWDEAIQIPAKI